MNEPTTAANAAFVEELTRFHSLRGTTLKIPKFNRSPLDLEKLWHAVRKSGGSSKVCEMKHWAQIGRIFGGTTADKNVSNNIKRAFTKWLLPYERAFFPEEAMSSSGEHSVSSTPRRKRQNTTPASNEKKSRSSSFEEKEPAPPLEPTELNPSLSAAASVTQPTAPSGPMPPAQRSYVSIPHSSESKICIILLPNTAAQDLNGTTSAPQLELPQQLTKPCPGNPIPDPVANGHVGANKEGGGMAPMTSPLTDQFTLSLLMNHNKDAPPSDVQQLLPNVSVLFKQDTQTPSTDPAAAVREPSEERGRNGDMSALANVPCSGLLCLLDSGMPVAQPDSAMITPKST